MAIIGIDLGTTNSACSVWVDGQSQLIPNRLGKFLTPSVVGIDDQGELLVGESAKHRLISHPTQTAACFKRHMGTEYLYHVGKSKFSAIELSSLVLKSLKEDAETFLNEPVSEAIISVPAYFNDVQRKATKLAGELAGLTVERLINEPTAAAMMYGLHQQVDGAQYLILDLGGGTFDVSLVEYFEGVIEVHASAGDNLLGGEDFTICLLDHCVKSTGINFQKLNPNEKQKLKNEVERTKFALGQSDNINVDIQLQGKTYHWSVDRSTFNKASESLYNRLRLPIEQAMRDAQVSPDELDEVILVGGATRTQGFNAYITKVFRRFPKSTLDPDLVVALGAGVQAGLKDSDQDLDDVVLTDVCPYTLGTGILNENDHDGQQGGLFLPIIERNNTVPISREKQVWTAYDNQEKLGIDVYQGESRLVKNNIKLGEFEVKVPKGPKGQESAKIRYSYDMNGLLEVDVTVTSTGETHSMTIINNDVSLSEEAIQTSREKLSQLKFHPREAEENRALLAKAERLYETSLGDKREYILNLIRRFEDILESQDQKQIKLAVKQFSENLDVLDQDGWL